MILTLLILALKGVSHSAWGSSLLWEYRPMVSSEASWEEANMTCFNQGGRLAVIQSETEHKQLKMAIKSTADDTDKEYWIGLTKSSQMWTWVDGSKVKYWNHWDWTLGSPNDTKNPNCMRVVGYNAQWRPKECFWSSKFICQLPQENPSTTNKEATTVPQVTVVTNTTEIPTISQMEKSSVSTQQLITTYKSNDESSQPPSSTHETTTNGRAVSNTTIFGTRPTTSTEDLSKKQFTTSPETMNSDLEMSPASIEERTTTRKTFEKSSKPQYSSQDITTPGKADSNTTIVGTGQTTSTKDWTMKQSAKGPDTTNPTEKTRAYAMSTPRNRITTLDKEVTFTNSMQQTATVETNSETSPQQVVCPVGFNRIHGHVGGVICKPFPSYENPDSRASAKIIGWLGIILVAVIGVLLVIRDLPKFNRDIKQMIADVRSRVVYWRSLCKGARCRD